jgi:hypothetical protein
MRFNPFLTTLCNSEDHIYNVIYRLRKTTGMFIHNAQPVHRIVQAKDCEPQRLSVFAAFCSSFTLAIAFRQSPLDRQLLRQPSFSRDRVGTT